MRIFLPQNSSKIPPQNESLDSAKFAGGYGPIIHVATPSLSPSRDRDRYDTALSSCLMNDPVAAGC